MMKSFTKEEIKILGIIFLFLIGATLLNFRVSFRKSRDSQRKNDIGALTKALEEGYQRYWGYFPLSTPDGKIQACKGSQTQLDKESGKYINLVGCEWGKDSLINLYDLSQPSFINTLPSDPQKTKGVTYQYFSNGKRYQIFVSLEGKDEDEYNLTIEKRNVMCGTRVCNYGKGYSTTPIDKTIEEYENELLQNKK